MKRAIISVSDKTGIVEFAQALVRQDFEIVSTGGTMKLLQQAGVPVTYVSDVTGFPEIMDGRVKTLNPYVHGGILAVRDNPEHMAALQQHHITAVDLVVVNLYPFRQTIEKPDVTQDEAIENIDIGGPSMIRAAAKNFRYVAVVVNPSRYQTILDELAAHGTVSAETRMLLAKEAFAHTATYDGYISNYLSQQLGQTFPDELHLSYQKVQDLRYGENPHQHAVFYREQQVSFPCVGSMRQLHGKELSFNNIVDVNAALELIKEFSRPAAAIIKHTNPCGAAEGNSLAEAYEAAFNADPVSAFGGIIAVNRVVDEDTAKKMATLFVEAIIAPRFDEAAVKLLSVKKNVRLLSLDCDELTTAAYVDIKRVAGGLLLQDADTVHTERADMTVVTKRQPTAAEWEQLEFAWRIVKHVKSNAIVLVKDGKTVGVGAGQMNRVGSVRIAAEQAGELAKGSVMGSDAFFPFKDNVEVAAGHGVTAIIQPGGSIRDAESIEEADRRGMAMVFTGVRHFKH